MRDQDQALRGCPTCGTRVKDIDIGLRDFSWLGDALPDRVGASDLDFVLEQSHSGRVLIIEMKPINEGLPLGQRLLLRRFVRLGADVWVVWDYHDGTKVRVGVMDKSGNVPFAEDTTLAYLRSMIGKWWKEGESS